MSHSDWHWCSSSCHLDLISHTRTGLVDTIAFLDSSAGGMIAMSGEHELLTKIHDILDNSVSKWVINMAHILAYVLNLLGFQVSLYGIEDFTAPSEAFLYGHISWSLTEAHHQSSLNCVSLQSL